MNEHAGPACALSGLIVGIFAILLHDRNPPPPVPKSPAHEASAAPRAEGPKPALREAIPGPKASATPTPPPLARAAPPAKAAVPPTAPRAIPPARPPVPAARPSPPSSRPSFAVVEPGESLEDVAARVYGSKGASEALWKANRDQVTRVDSPLAGGTLLRTP